MFCTNVLYDVSDVSTEDKTIICTASLGGEYCGGSPSTVLAGFAN